MATGGRRRKSPEETGYFGSFCLTQLHCQHPETEPGPVRWWGFCEKWDSVIDTCNPAGEGGGGEMRAILCVGTTEGWITHGALGSNFKLTCFGLPQESGHPLYDHVYVTASICQIILQQNRHITILVGWFCVSISNQCIPSDKTSIGRVVTAAIEA